MQKKLLTLAVAGVLAAPAAALADVTVYGTVDTGIRQQSKIATTTVTIPSGVPGVPNISVVTAEDSQLQMFNNPRTTNRWGLKGSEDLGGGMRMNFTLEGTYTSDATGDSLDGFNRKSIIGLSTGTWAVDWGRDYTVNFKSQGIYDPMSFTYTGITPAAGTNVAGTRSDDMVTAGFKLGVVNLRVDYALGEVAGQGSWGTRTGVGVDGAAGPVKWTVAFSTQKDPVDGSMKTTTTNFGGAYTMGAFTFRAGYSNTEYKESNIVAFAKAETPMFLLGAQYAISPTMNGRLGYYSTKFEHDGIEEGKRGLIIVALDYYLSKSTTAYVAFDRHTFKDLNFGINATGAVTNPSFENGTVAGQRSADGSTGITVGMVHAF